MVTVSVVAIAVTPSVRHQHSTTLLFMALLGGICVRGFAQGLNLPLMMIILSRNVAPHLQGRVTALRISFNRFGGLLVPPGMGALADMDAVGGLANAFYIVGIGWRHRPRCALSLWVLFSPRFKKE